MNHLPGGVGVFMRRPYLRYKQVCAFLCVFFYSINNSTFFVDYHPVFEQEAGLSGLGLAGIEGVIIVGGEEENEDDGEADSPPVFRECDDGKEKVTHVEEDLVNVMKALTTK
jgi:hypothetical protein